MHSILKASLPSRGMMGFSQMLHTGANFLEGRERTPEAFTPTTTEISCQNGAWL